LDKLFFVKLVKWLEFSIFALHFGRLGLANGMIFIFLISLVGF